MIHLVPLMNNSIEQLTKGKSDDGGQVSYGWSEEQCVVGTMTIVKDSI